MSEQAHGARLSGLSQAEAERRLATHGPNALPNAAGKSLWRRFRRQLKSPLIHVLMFALALDLLLRVRAGADRVRFEALTIAVILLLNAGRGVWQESKAEAALLRLKALAAPSVWALRDGVLMRIPASTILPGDLARIAAGDRLPADGCLAHGQGVMVDESILRTLSFISES